MYEMVIAELSQQIKYRQELKKKIESLKLELESAQLEYDNLGAAQKLLATVSDDNTEVTLGFITSVINKTLAEIFKNDVRKIQLKKKLYGGARPHIVVELVNGDGNSLDLSIQSGAGLREVISFMFTICLIEIKKGRRIFISDEKLAGLHKEAKKIVSEIIKIFAEGGFQFVLVEYALNDLGKIYNVEKPSKDAVVFPLDDGVKYDDSTVFMFSHEADLSVVDKDYVDDVEEDNFEGEEIIGT